MCDKSCNHMNMEKCHGRQRREEPGKIDLPEVSGEPLKRTKWKEGCVADNGRQGDLGGACCSYP